MTRRCCCGTTAAEAQADGRHVGSVGRQQPIVGDFWVLTPLAWVQVGSTFGMRSSNEPLKLLIYLAGVAGLEPATPGFGDRCSTN
jgi:hypothetical protein